MDPQSLISMLVRDREIYENWHDQSTDREYNAVFNYIWLCCDQRHNEFTQGVKHYWQLNGNCTYRQFFYVIRYIHPELICDSVPVQRQPLRS